MSGTLGLGILYRQKIYGRLESLRVMIKILEIIKSEVEYANSTLVDCCTAVSESLEEVSKEEAELKSCFESICQRLKTERGGIFQKVLREELEKVKEQTSLQTSDIRSFTSFCDHQGFQDRSIQLRMIERSRHSLEENARRLRECAEEKTKIGIGLGVLGGIFLVILLI